MSIVAKQLPISATAEHLLRMLKKNIFFIDKLKVRHISTYGLFDVLTQKTNILPT